MGLRASFHLRMEGWGSWEATQTHANHTTINRDAGGGMRGEMDGITQQSAENKGGNNTKNNPIIVNWRGCQGWNRDTTTNQIDVRIHIRTNAAGGGGWGQQQEHNNQPKWSWCYFLFCCWYQLVCSLIHKTKEQNYIVLSIAYRTKTLLTSLVDCCILLSWNHRVCSVDGFNFIVRQILFFYA